MVYPISICQTTGPIIFSLSRLFACVVRKLSFVQGIRGAPHLADAFPLCGVIY